MTSTPPTSSAYYNEIEPYPAQWLHNLQRTGCISSGTIDIRSIHELDATDLTRHNPVHLFAGIGGWDLALRMAGWPISRYRTWTGSCPCQPFSMAGKRKGVNDHRHLWPEMSRLINECQPDVVFGEQVASADGRDWLAGVQTDLEKMGFAFGAADICAAGESAPHIRQRLYWVGARIKGMDNTTDARRAGESKCGKAGKARDNTRMQELGGRGRVDGLAYSQRHAGEQGRTTSQPRKSNGAERTGTRDKSGRRSDSDAASGGLGHHHQGLEGRVSGELPEYTDQLAPWQAGTPITCLDGKARRIPHPESGILPLAHGVSQRVGKLRAYGNAIVPQVAAGFISAFMDVMEIEKENWSVHAAD